MAGYAVAAPALALGPPGWVVWALAGTALTIGAVYVGSEAVQLVRERDRTRSEPRVVPQTRTCDPTSTTEECKNRRFTVAIHAQGVDCGGKSSSTIGATAVTRNVPVTVGEGLALSNATWALLTWSQQKIRLQAKEKAEGYISSGPQAGGRFREKSFPASDARGGKRYDVSCWGDGPSFLA